MFRVDVLTYEFFGFLGGKGENAFARLAQREIDGSGHPFDGRVVPFDFTADPFGECRRGPQQSIGRPLSFALEGEQQMFGFNLATAQLAGFKAGEEDGSPGTLGIALEHIRTVLQTDRLGG